MTAVTASSQTYVLTDQDNRWVTWIAVSLLLHAAVFGFFWWLSQRPVKPPVRDHAIMVQPVAWAPQKRPEHWLPRMQATPEPEAVKPEVVKVTQNANAAIESEAEKKKREEEEKKRAEKERKDREQRMNAALRKIKNNYKDWDGDPNGVKGGLSTQALAVLGNAYAIKLSQAFRTNFAVPETIPNEDVEKLKAKILVKIDSRGTIIDHKLMEGSGNAIFDSAALRAVKRTRTVPLPDDELKRIIFKDGILINFSWKL
jgi:colicin import membrane protein